MPNNSIVVAEEQRFFSGQTWVYAPSKLSAWDGSVTITPATGANAGITAPAISEELGSE